MHPEEGRKKKKERERLLQIFMNVPDIKPEKAANDIKLFTVIAFL